MTKQLWIGASATRRPNGGISAAVDFELSDGYPAKRMLDAGDRDGCGITEMVVPDDTIREAARALKMIDLAEYDKAVAVERQKLIDNMQAAEAVYNNRSAADHLREKELTRQIQELTAGRDRALEAGCQEKIKADVAEARISGISATVRELEASIHGWSNRALLAEEKLLNRRRQERKSRDQS